MLSVPPLFHVYVAATFWRYIAIRLAFVHITLYAFRTFEAKPKHRIGGLNSLVCQICCYSAAIMFRPIARAAAKAILQVADQEAALRAHTSPRSVWVPP